MPRGGREEEEDEEGKGMCPLFPRLHVNDAGKGGGPRAPPRNKMALYEQFTVPSHRFSAPAPTRGGGGGTLVPTTSMSQVYGCERPFFQPFNAPSNEFRHSSERIVSNSINRQVNGSRKESGRLSSQTKGKDVYAECTSQKRVEIGIHNSSGRKLNNDNEVTIPSFIHSRFHQYSTQEYAVVQEKSTTFCAANPHKSPPAMSKSSPKCYNSVTKHFEKTNVPDVKSKGSLKYKEKEPEQTSKNMEAEKCSSIQASQDRFGSKHAKLYLKRDKTGITYDSDKLHIGNYGYQVAGISGSAMKPQNPPMTRNAIPSKPSNGTDNTNKHSNLPQGVLMETSEKRKKSLAHHDAQQSDDLDDSSVECIPGTEICPDKIVGAIGSMHFWKARKAILNQQRVFAVQVFELHKLVKVQKLIAASPHVLIEGDPCLGNALVRSKNKLAEGNLKEQPLLVTDKDDIQPTLQQPELLKENTEDNIPSPSRDDGLDSGHHDQAATNGVFTSKHPTMPVASDDKQNNWGVHPSSNQWLVPVMSPSEGLIYKPYAGPCPPAGSLLAPFYGDFTNSSYGAPMAHQPQHMGAPGPPAMQMNYFPPFSIPMMNPAQASSVGQQSHPAASQPNGLEQNSRISCNMSHPSGIWRFHASRDSELQASSVSSPFDRLQGDGTGSVPLFPMASVQNSQPQPSSGSRGNRTNVIKVVPHNAQTASESAAWIFRSIQMERQQNNSSR